MLGTRYGPVGTQFLILGTQFSLILGTRFSLILGTRFSILGTRFSILGTRFGSLKRLKNTLAQCEIFS